MQHLRKNASVRWMISAKSLQQQRAGCVWSSGRHLHWGNSLSLECNNFLHETKETFQSGFQAAGDPSKKAFELILAHSCQEQAIQSSGIPTSFGNTVIQTREYGAVSCSPRQFWEVFLEVPGRLLKENQLMDCAVRTVFPGMAKSDDWAVSSVNTPAHRLLQTAPNCLLSLLSSSSSYWLTL